MTRLCSLFLFFVLLSASPALQVAAARATLEKTNAPARYYSVARPQAASLVYADYNLQLLVRAMGWAYEFYGAIDTARHLPANFRAAEPLLAEGDRLRRANKKDEAIEAYRRAVRLFDGIPIPVMARSYLGQALVFGEIPEQRTKAIQLLRQVMLYTPDNAAASLALTLNYCFLLEWDKALTAAQRTVAITPDDPQAHYWLAWVYFHGVLDTENGMKEYQAVLRLKPNDINALNDLGLGYLYTRQYAKALITFQRSARLEADNVDAHWFLGVTYLQMSNKPQAQQIHLKLKRINKDLAAEFAQRL